MSDCEVTVEIVLQACGLESALRSTCTYFGLISMCSGPLVCYRSGSYFATYSTFIFVPVTHPWTRVVSY